MAISGDTSLREMVRHLVDEIPESELSTAQRFLQYLSATTSEMPTPSSSGLITGSELTPITLAEISYEGRTLRFKEPLTANPFFDKEYGLLFVEIPEIGVMSGGDSRETLIADLVEDIYLRWIHYAENDDPTLAGDAAMYRENLRRLMEEVS